MADFYNGNPNLPKSNLNRPWTKEEIEDYIRCANDPVYFAEKHFRIVHVDRGLEKIKLYDFQKEAIESYSNYRRVAILSGRQQGKTSLATVIVLHYCIFNKNKFVALLANKGDTAREILSRIQLAYEYLPEHIKSAGVTTWNKGSVEFGNGCKIIAAATSSSAIRGKSCVVQETKICVEIDDSIYYCSIADINKREFINIKDDNMIYTVYKTTNLVNGKEYVGFHKIKNKKSILTNASLSGSVYRDGYLGSGKLIRDAIALYGPENFMQTILFISKDREEAEKFERDLVNKEYCDREDTYNLSIGGNVCILYGKHNGFYGKRHTKETIKKIYETRKSNNSFGNNGTKFIDNNGILYVGQRELINKFNLSKNYRNEILELVFNKTIRCVDSKKQEQYINEYNKLIEYRNYVLNNKENRHKQLKESCSIRFKGKKQSKEQIDKRTISTKIWRENNKELVQQKMNSINKNPEKIRKTAEKHRGMKRSKETCLKISQGLRNREIKPDCGKGGFYIHNDITKEIKRWNESKGGIPDGWSRGFGKRK